MYCGKVLVLPIHMMSHGFDEALSMLKATAALSVPDP